MPATEATLTENLAKAHVLRESGYQSLLHAQPHVREAFISLWQQDISLRECRRILVQNFPEDSIPSVNALSNYLKNHSHDNLKLKKVDYAKKAAEFDALDAMYDAVEQIQKAMELAKAGNAKLSTMSRLANSYFNMAYKVLDMELKLGIRVPYNQQ